jgi:Ni/Fe-hydrogenase subunit HybB-like protein/Fe-S-cluster-containing dehydrogenase component
MSAQPARRDILKYAGALTVGAGALSARSLLAAEPAEPHGAKLSPDAKGVLVDLSGCIGCRLCEYACKKANGFEAGAVASYDDMSVFAHQRRPTPTGFTVVNAYGPGGGTTRSADTVYAKVNCLHCNHAACVSACIVGALSKNENGAVEYDSWKCIGCRYCMVACPFQIPTYEYDNVLTPQVRKCELCPQRTSKGELPACVKECPRQVMTYGKRSELLALARQRIGANPGKYVDHIYGEHEVGGTSWMYISKVPFERAGCLKVGTAAPPALTEAIQHGGIKHWIAPIGWYGFLGAMYWVTGRRNAAAVSAHAHKVEREVAQVSAGGGGGHGASLPDVPPVEHHDHAHHAHEPAEPVSRKLLTPGVWVLIAMVLTGAAFGLYRFFFGLAAATNLDQQHPWGLWIAMDVGSGIALAGGGFVTAALVHIFHREHYHAIARCALLTALLGYTFYVPGLLADLGRWYNLWHTTLPMMWQGNSVLFEVGMCVMIYLNVQYAEITPIICERFIRDKTKWPKISAWAKRLHDVLEWIMPALLCLGVALSTFHQSSLGNLMVIAPYKLHRLWWSPVSPVLFLLSAMMVGFPMVIFTMLFGSWCLKRKPEMYVLAPMTRYVLIFMFAYLGVKVGDMALRGTWQDLLTPSLQSAAWLVEMAGGVVLPLILLLIPAVRASARWLAIACLMVILGVVLNRLNVFIIGYRPPFAEKVYVPSVTEFALSFGLVAALMLVWRIAVTYLPILQPAPAVASEEA